MFFARVADEASHRDPPVELGTPLDVAADAVAIVDDESDVSYVNRGFASMHGYDGPSQLLGTPLAELYDEPSGRRLEDDVVPTVERTGHWRGELVGIRRGGSRFTQEVLVTALGDGELVIGTWDDTTRRSHIRTVESLSRNTSALLSARGVDEIADLALAAVTDTFGYDVGCVRLFDETSNTLDVTATTEVAATLVETYPTFDLHGTAAGRAYRRGEVVINAPTDESTESDVHAGASVHLPLAEYGTLTVFCDTADLSSLDTHRLELLAATVGAALERDERERALRRNERELREQHTRLDTLQQITTVIQNLIRQLVEADSRGAIHQTVCDRLVESAFFRSAWIGTAETEDGDVTPVAAAGVSERYLSLVASASPAQVANGTVSEAVRTREIQTVRQHQVRTSGAGGDVESDPESEHVESVAAVPLGHGSRTYGVLVITTSRRNAFSDATLTGLEVLGDVIGFSIYAALNRELLLSDSIVELKLQVRDARCLPVAFSSAMEARCTLVRSTSAVDDGTVCYLRIEAAPADRVLDVAAEMDRIDDYRLVTESDDGALLEVSSSGIPFQSVTELGGSIPEVVAVDGVATIFIEGHPAKSRDLVEAFREEFPDSELVAKREVERPIRTADAFRQQLTDQFTPRQQAALETAYVSGYFDWPRKSTAEEIAAAMGIASPTFHQHLRKAERKLVDALLDSPSTAAQ
ncbi:bacterio-opsin activator domain-containing protein [Haloarculaceae archaeon H-GB11]|nr:bacterio-opsin activator domain-containing protein [Haloarculaceae archaeon H-GB11]